MVLLTLDKICLSYGQWPLLDKVSCVINERERICLIGRNGTGKSSLLKLLQGDITPDSGSFGGKPELKIATLSQDLPLNQLLSVYDWVAQGLAEIGQLLQEYHSLSLQLTQTEDSDLLKKLETVHQKIEACHGWAYEQRITQTLQHLELPADAIVSNLSGGWQRRAALAKALVTEPDLLLLDEPTNHLDIASIIWLENELFKFQGSIIFVTHDRQFLQNLATNIWALDRGNLTQWPGDYKNYLRRRDELLQAEEKEQHEFDKKLAGEEQWIRQGIKARRTRNEGRVRALKSLRQQRSQRREQMAKANFSIEQGQRSGQLVIEAQNLVYDYQDQKLIDDFSVRIMRGDKIALIGPNGCGKTTLLQLLLGQSTPQQGQVKLGTNLEVAYFDQHRQSLELDKSVIDNVAEGRESIQLGKRSLHIISYLKEFLFTPQQARMAVENLSGGERNRVLLARLFSQPANLLVLDEPTNDLDIETLELLEEKLLDFGGTLLLVSHDRAFIDSVVTSTIAFLGNGLIKEFVGGYEDYLRQLKLKPKKEPKNLGSQEKSTDHKTTKKPKDSNKQKLSYKEQRELAQLPQKIEQLENEYAALQATISSAEFYKGDPAQINATLEEFKNLEKTIAQSYARWDELENF